MAAREKNIVEIIQLMSSGRRDGKRKVTSLTHKIQLFQKIVSGLDAVIFIYDLKEGRTVWTNGKYPKLLGYDDNDILRLKLGINRDEVHPNDLPVMQEGDELIRSGIKDSFSGIYRAMNKDGNWIWMYYHINLIKPDEAEPRRYVIGWTVNFTSQMYNEKQLKQLMAEHRRMVHSLQLQCLTSREKEIVRYLVDGHSCKEISTFFGITYYTTLTHIRNLHHKLGINNTAELMHFASESGLTD